MTELVVQLAAGVILMGMSAIGTAFLGFISRFRKIRKDLNAAHIKIRKLERKVFNDRDAREGGDEPCGENDY